MSEDLELAITNIRYRIRMKDPSGFEDAIKLANKYPENPHAWYVLSYAHERTGNDAAAMAAIHRAIQLDARQPSWFLTRGGYALRTDDNEGAAADFTQGLVLCDELASDYLREAFHAMRADAFVRLGRTAEARADLAHVQHDVIAEALRVRSKAELLALCGVTLPLLEDEDDDAPESLEPLDYSGNLLVESRAALAEFPDEDESALAKELGDDGLAAVDAALIKHVIDRYLKVARVIWDALAFGGYSPKDKTRIRLYARRIITLAEAGRIIARGNLHRPGASEVQLPDHG